MINNLRTLNYVVTAAELGSVTKAAKVLNVSQPSISSAINAAERQAGVELFLRQHAKGITITPAGRHFVREARLLLKHSQDFDLAVADLGGGLKGEITVGSFVTLATRYMPGLLAEFAQRAPDVTVLLEEGNQAEIIEALLSGRMEIALSYTYSMPDGIVGEPLAELPPYLLLCEDHPLAKQDKISLYDIVDEPFILLDLPHSREYFENLFAINGLIPRVGYRTKSYELIRGLMGRGRGYTIHNVLPGTSLTYDGGRVLARPIVERLPSVTIMALGLNRRPMRAAVRAFSDLLSEAFKSGEMFETKRR